MSQTEHIKIGQFPDDEDVSGGSFLEHDPEEGDDE